MDRVGPYVIDRKLGTGGMGTVYLGTHEETGRQAAVKVLPASLAREEGFHIRFHREIEALEEINNTNVVRIYDSGRVSDDEDSALYYAMEYVDGETLLMLLRRERRLPWRTVIDYGIQICQALKAAHNAGVTHRDLKPSNLLVSRDGTIKLADFGVALKFGAASVTRPDSVIGTAEFMSPEQAKGERATKKSDLYSLGAVLYTMLTGKPPYSGQTMLDVLHKHRFGQFDRPRHYAPECPSWLEDLVCQLLEKDPAKRPADAHVTAKRLREIPLKVELSQSEPLPAEAAAARALPEPPTDQEILSHEDRAIDSPLHDTSDVDSDAVTRTAPGLSSRGAAVSPRGPGEATLMHALMKQEFEAQQKGHPVQTFFENMWVQIGLLALLLLGGVFWYRSLPTPEWHFAEAERLIAAGDYSTARVDHLQPLLREDGDWPQRAQERIDESRRLEREQSPERERRRLRPREENAPSPPAAPGDRTAGDESDRLLRRATAYRDLGETAKAIATLEAFLAVTSADDPAMAEQRKQADAMLIELRNPAETSEDRTEMIQAALKRAATLARTDRSAAEAIYRGLLTLYGDDPAAAELLEPAREALDGE